MATFKIGQRVVYSLLFNFKSNEKDELGFLEKRKISIELKCIENKIFELIEIKNK